MEVYSDIIKCTVRRTLYVNVNTYVRGKSYYMYTYSIYIYAVIYMYGIQRTVYVVYDIQCIILYVVQCTKYSVRSIVYVVHIGERIKMTRREERGERR